MGSRRSTDSNASQPAFKVVGFRVEGVPPSPAQAGLLGHDTLTSGGGSPDPVIIPPSFQSDIASRLALPASPERVHTLPSFVPNSESTGIRDVLGTLATGAQGHAAPDIRRPYSPQRALAQTSSLPPMTGDVSADWKRFASSMSRTSPPQLSPRAQREVKSQPTSANATPPVSPFRPDQDFRPSTSYRPQSMFEQHPRIDGNFQQAATFTDGSRLPERRIQVHMGQTYSDGIKIPPLEPSRHELGTPRQQHGFQVPLDATPRQQTPFAAPATAHAQAATPRTSQTGFNVPSGSITTSAVESREATSALGSPGKVASSELPAVPGVLTTTAIARGPAGDHAAEPAHPSQPGKRQKEAKPSKEAKGKPAGVDPTGESSRRPEQGGKEAGEKSKATTKAERRAIQEKQRAEKAAAKEQAGKQRSGQPSAASQPSGGPRSTAVARPEPAPASRSAAQNPPSPQPPAYVKQPSKNRASQPTGRTSEMFAHLPQYKAITIDNVFQESPVAAKVHPAVLQLGLRYAGGNIAGSNARCLAMLLTFKAVIKDYQIPESKELSRDLTSQLNLCIQFLVECRPLSVSMGTAIKNLKLKVSQISADTPQEEAKLQLLDEIDTFIQEKITYADEQVARIAQTKVADGDVVMTFGFSSAVLNSLLAAKEAGKQFRVVVADSRPHYEGKLMVAKLLASGVAATYLHLNALCFVMQEVSKVFMGAAGAMSNGTIIGKAGAASVAMAAHAMQRPVIVCCETLKFVDRVQLDSITYNELGDPDSLAQLAEQPEMTELLDWREQPHLELLNLMYDAMPCDYVTMIVTEVGAIPPTSVPVILREYRTAPKM